MPDRNQFDQFDQALEALLTGSAPPAGLDTEVEALLAIARDLRELPRESFKASLKSEIERKSSMATMTEPTLQLQTATPRLRLRNVAAAIEFYAQAFGAKEISRFEVGGHIPYAEISLGNSQIALGEASADSGYPGPESLGGSPVDLSLDVEDADAAVGKAVAAGGKLVRPVQNHFYGERGGSVLDPFGYTWNISTRLEDLSIEEMHRRFEAEQSAAAAKQTGVSPVPAGYRTITPYIVASDADAFLAFVKQVFGAQENFRGIGSAGGIHAEVKLGDSMMMVGGGGPGLTWKGDPIPTALHVYVEDVDAVYDRALAAGAAKIQPPQDHDYGERGASVRDAAGNHWYLATYQGASYIPEGFHTVTVSLHPLRAEPVLNFIQHAFGGTDVQKYATPDGVIPHATIRIGDSILEMGEAHGPYQPMPSMLYLYVPNVDDLYRRALSAGATSIAPPTDHDYGDRSGGVKDPFGNQWFIATHFKDVTP